ncbi:HlyD family efflux transporter periplasmic adaptor subunit [Labilibacter sediminis]|nr:HlyD family efflux transporter periplasmic adaptor subunit [Labilibacter sediminis]
MKKRVIAITISLVIIIAAFAIVKALPTGKSSGNVNEEIKPTLIEVMFPAKGDVAYHISSTGKIEATERVEIFSEVDGVLLSSARVFKPGKTYKKGETMLQIEVDEFKMTLLSQKSEFITLLTSILPDLKSDYPDSYQTWREYALALDVNKPLPKLPEPKGSQENFFLSGRSVYSTFYNIQSSEERLKKYTITAPYSGIVTATMVEAGKAVRTGTQLGTFINPSKYDLEVTIPLTAMKDVKIGTQAELSSSELDGSWTGKVTRISGDIDEMSQSVKVYIQTSGNDLKEGMYLTANIAMSSIPNSYSLPRKMLNDKDEVFVVENNKLKLKKVNVLMRQGDVAIVEGIDDTQAVMSTVIKNAHDGMPVSIKN